MDDSAFGFKYERMLSETINLEDKYQLHSKPKDCLASKEFLSIHQILHPESTDLSTRTHTGNPSWDSAIPPTAHDCTTCENCRTTTGNQSYPWNSQFSLCVNNQHYNSDNSSEKCSGKVCFVEKSQHIISIRFCIK